MCRSRDFPVILRDLHAHPQIRVHRHGSGLRGLGGSARGAVDGRPARFPHERAPGNVARHDHRADHRPRRLAGSSAVRTCAPRLVKPLSKWCRACLTPRTPRKSARPNEGLFGVRFIGDRAFAITFRQIDPFYVLDLANPADPRIAGQLLIPGFSDFLHPVTQNLLLGLGRESNNTKVELFDVSVLEQPQSRGRIVLDGWTSYSEAEFERHAFTYLPADSADRFAIPATVTAGPAAGRSHPGTVVAVSVRDPGQTRCRKRVFAGGRRCDATVRQRTRTIRVVIAIVHPWRYRVLRARRQGLVDVVVRAVAGARAVLMAAI